MGDMASQLTESKSGREEKNKNLIQIKICPRSRKVEEVLHMLDITRHLLAVP